MQMASGYFKVLELQKDGLYNNPMDYQMSQCRLDNLINRLLKGTNCWDRSGHDTFKSEIDELCLATRDILLKEPSLLELKAPIKIADGTSLETTLLLFAFKIKYPNNVFLLRGNHDGGSLQRRILVDELELDHFVFEEVVNDCLKSVPVAALINNKILCTHGGLSPDLHNLDQIRHINRPAQIPNSGLLHDLLGSNPTKAQCYANTFGARKVQKFLVKHDLRRLRLIFCANQIVGGYKVYAGQRGAMICSASKQPKIEFDDDAGAMINSAKQSEFEFDNAGAMMSVDENLLYSFHILKPKHGYLDYSFMDATTQPESSSAVNLTCEIAMNKYGEDPPLKEDSETSTSKSESSPGNNPSASTLATKYRSMFTGFKLANWTSKSNSENSASTSKYESSQGVNHSVIKSATNHRSVSPDQVKRAERLGQSNFVSGTRTPARAANYRSDSPEVKIERNNGSGKSGAETESKPGTNPSKFDFDPANLYRSKSPGVKRFLGARV